MAYVIDGNNFLGYAFPGQHRDPENRRALVRKLLAFVRFSRVRVVLVFDGPASDEIAEMTRGEARLRVQYAPEGGSADDAIFGLIERQKDRRHLAVVSTDREIRGFAKESGAGLVLTCREFEGRLKRTLGERKAFKEMEKPALNPSKLEVGLWLSVFGGEGKGRR